MNVNIISLNQIIDLFSNFSQRHYFIKDFGYGATSEIGTSRQMEFPYMWLSLDQNSTIVVQNKTTIPQYGITVLFMDKINIQKNYLDINGVNSDNSQEILSDTLQLLQDLITEINTEWGNYGLMIEGNVNCFPGVDETTDKVNGWVGQFLLKVKHSNCILPTGDIIQTNISPINPYTRYLTCETLPTCQVIQDIETDITNLQSQITGFTSYYTTGGTYNSLTESIDFEGNNPITTFSVDVSQLLDDTNTYVTGGTFSPLTETLTLQRNDGVSIDITGFTSDDFYTTGFTYNDNTFTISDNSGNTFSATINTMTGLTINGELDVNIIQFNTGITPTFELGTLAWNGGDTLNIGLLNNHIHRVGQEMLFYGKASGSISKGDSIMFAGTQGDHILFTKADPVVLNQNPEYFMGLAPESLNNNDWGYITHFGYINGLNTLSYSAGTLLWAQTSGVTTGLLTNVKPISPNAQILTSVVVRSHITQGTLLVRPTIYPHLKDIQNVRITGTPDNGDVLTYNSTDLVWEPQPTAQTFTGYTYVDENTSTPYFYIEVPSGYSTSAVYINSSNITLQNVDASTLLNSQIYLDSGTIQLICDDGLTINMVEITPYGITGIPFITGGTYDFTGDTLTLNNATGGQIPITGFTYERQTDYVYPYYYGGTAPLFTLTSTPNWIIKRADYTIVGSPVIQQAIGSWDNRYSLIYT